MGTDLGRQTPSLLKQHVLDLDVPVHNIIFMKVTDGEANLLEDMTSYVNG